MSKNSGFIVQKIIWEGNAVTDVMARRGLGLKSFSLCGCFLHMMFDPLSLQMQWTLCICAMSCWIFLSFCFHIFPRMSFSLSSSSSCFHWFCALSRAIVAKKLYLIKRQWHLKVNKRRGMRGNGIYKNYTCCLVGRSWKKIRGKLCF